jgi:hypothetical protein
MANNPAGTKLGAASHPQILSLDVVPFKGGRSLDAGGTKSCADIVELLAHNPDADMAAIRSLCQSWRLSGLDPLIEEATGGS